jgi:PIN domain nuclease of toxin-antitoxin system
MHRITYTKKELESLLNILRDNISTEQISNLDIEMTYKTLRLSFDSDFDIFYKKAKNTLSQFLFEIIFHIPLKTALLSVTHKDLIVRLIVLWRIEIQK